MRRTLKDALQPYSRCVAFSLLKVATNVPRPACSMARRESATRSRWRTERGRLATAATAPHGLHPLSRLWPSNSLPARRAHSNAPAAPADCQCYPGGPAAAGRCNAAASPPQQRRPRMLPPAMSPPAAAPSRRCQLPPALQRQLSLLPRRRRGHECHRHECRRRQRRHGRCRRQAGERGAPYDCVCLEAVALPF